MKNGTVICDSDNNKWVITEMENGEIVRKEPLESYVSNIVVVEFNGEYRTIKEITEICCQNYMDNNEIIIN
jgi:formylmethanofuran dehydrogenase subunit C